MDRVLICSEPAHGGWLPSWAGPVAGALHVDWCHFGESALHEPFFEDSLARAMRQPVNQLLRHRTPIEALGALHARRPGLQPSGFVFHASRCGSTLVAQMLAALPDAVVLSEASPLDAVLQSGGDTRQRTDWLVWMLSALGQPRRPGDRRLFVKFDAWHARQLPLIRQAYPDTPWVYLYRDPREVLASQLRQPGAFLVPGLLDGGATAESGSIAQRVACMLSETGLAALAALRSSGGMLLNYVQLPGAVPRQMAHHFGLGLDADESSTLLAVARFNAKTPALPFERATCSADALSESDLRTLERDAMPVYHELERTRAFMLM